MRHLPYRSWPAGLEASVSDVAVFESEDTQRETETLEMRVRVEGEPLGAEKVVGYNRGRRCVLQIGCLCVTATDRLCSLRRIGSDPAIFCKHLCASRE